MDAWSVVFLYRRLLRTQEKEHPFEFIPLPEVSRNGVLGTPFTPRVASTSRAVLLLPKTPSRLPSVPRGTSRHQGRFSMDVDIPMARTSNTSTTMSRATTPSSPSRIGHGYGGIPGILPFLSPVAEEPNTALRVEENVDGDVGNMAESVTEEVLPEVSGVSMLPGSGNKETSAPPSSSVPLTTVPDCEDGEDGEDV